MPVRVVPGEIGVKDVTTRTVLPNSSKLPLPPFVRVAETIATPRRPFPPHHHEGVEVLTYVIEGAASHVLDSGPPEQLSAGSTTLLTAPTPIAHSINPGQGQTVRWFAAVVTLPPGAVQGARYQTAPAEATGVQPEGTVVRHLAGPGAAITSVSGLEGVAIEFRTAGTVFRKVGHGRVAIAYALSGRGAIDNQPLEVGEAALVQEAAGVALAGKPGFRAVLVTAPQGS